MARTCHEPSVLYLLLETETLCVSVCVCVCVCVCARVRVLSHVQLFVVYPTPLSMGCSRQDTGVGCHFLLQGIFPMQGWNMCLWCLLHWQVGSLPLSHLGSPRNRDISVLKSRQIRQPFWKPQNQVRKLIPKILFP